jgi:hypothetical protein
LTTSCTKLVTHRILAARDLQDEYVVHVLSSCERRCMLIPNVSSDDDTQLLPAAHNAGSRERPEPRLADPLAGGRGAERERRRHSTRVAQDELAGLTPAVFQCTEVELGLVDR